MIFQIFGKLLKKLSPITPMIFMKENWSRLSVKSTNVWSTKSKKLWISLENKPLWSEKFYKFWKK